MLVDAYGNPVTLVRDDPSDDPGKGPGFKITDVWLFSRMDERGGEGIVSVRQNGQWIPFVAGDTRRRDMLAKWSQDMADAMRVEIDVLHFSQRTQISKIRPSMGGRTVPGVVPRGHR